MRLLQGDNIELLKTLAPNSVDSVVTDPPYGLKFMNKKWDHSVPSVEFWSEVLRVLKPGGHGLGDKGGASRFFYCAKASKSERNAGLEGMEQKYNDFQRETSGLSQGKDPITGERSGKRLQPNQNHHPTVKPIKLMQYLIKLVTPPGGTVLDPFMGFGSTGVAANNLGFDFIGMELSEDYFDIATKRVESL